VTGKVVGTVVDRDTGEPLVGAQVVVEGTNLGEVVQAEGIVATIEREPLIIRDNMISKSRFTGEEARSLPTSSIDQVVELGAGMSSSAGSMSS
jgi:hypothetical protein